MSLEQMSFLAQIVSALVVVASLIFVGFQLNHAAAAILPRPLPGPNAETGASRADRHAQPPVIGEDRLGIGAQPREPTGRGSDWPAGRPCLSGLARFGWTLSRCN